MNILNAEYDEGVITFNDGFKLEVSFDYRKYH